MASKFKFGAAEFGSGSGFGTKQKETTAANTGIGASRSPSVVYDDLNEEEQGVYKPLYKEYLKDHPDDQDGAMMYAEDGLFTWQNNQKYFDPKGNIVAGALNINAQGRQPSIAYDDIENADDQKAYKLGYKGWLRAHPEDYIGASIAGEDEMRRDRLTPDQQLAESMLGDLGKNDVPLYLRDPEVIKDLLTMNGATEQQIAGAFQKPAEEQGTQPGFTFSANGPKVGTEQERFLKALERAGGVDALEDDYTRREIGNVYDALTNKDSMRNYSDEDLKYYTGLLEAEMADNAHYQELQANYDEGRTSLTPEQALQQERAEWDQNKSAEERNRLMQAALKGAYGLVAAGNYVTNVPERWKDLKTLGQNFWANFSKATTDIWSFIGKTISGEHLYNLTGQQDWLRPAWKTDELGIIQSDRAYANEQLDIAQTMNKDMVERAKSEILPVAEELGIDKGAAEYALSLGADVLQGTSANIGGQGWDFLVGFMSGPLALTSGIRDVAASGAANITALNGGSGFLGNLWNGLKTAFSGPTSAILYANAYENDIQELAAEKGGIDKLTTGDYWFGAADAFLNTAVEIGGGEDTGGLESLYSGKKNGESLLKRLLSTSLEEPLEEVGQGEGKKSLQTLFEAAAGKEITYKKPISIHDENALINVAEVGDLVLQTALQSFGMGVFYEGANGLRYVANKARAGIALNKQEQKLYDGMSAVAEQATAQAEADQQHDAFQTEVNGENRGNNKTTGNVDPVAQANTGRSSIPLEAAAQQIVDAAKKNNIQLSPEQVQALINGKMEETKPGPAAQSQEVRENERGQSPEPVRPDRQLQEQEGKETVAAQAEMQTGVSQAEIDEENRRSAEARDQAARDAASQAAEAQGRQADERAMAEDNARKNREEMAEVTQAITDAAKQNGIDLTEDEVRRLIEQDETGESAGYEGEPSEILRGETTQDAVAESGLTREGSERGEGTAQGTPEAEGQTDAERMVREETGGTEGNQGTDAQEETAAGESSATGTRETEGQVSEEQQAQEEAGETGGSQGTEAATAEDILDVGEGEAQGTQETEGQISEEQRALEEAGETGGNEGTEAETAEGSSQNGEGAAQSTQETNGQVGEEQQAEEESKNAETVSKSNGWSYLQKGQKAKAGVNVESWSGTEVSEAQKAVLNILDKRSRESGIITIFHSRVEGGDANGMYTERDEQGRMVIHIAQDASDPYQTVFSHELIHLIRSNNPEGYQRIEQAVMDYLRSAGTDVNAELEKLRSRYREMGKKNPSIKMPDDGTLREEMVAYSVFDAIGDENTIRSLAAQDRGLVQKIQDWLRRVIRDIHEMLDRYTERTPTAKALRDTEGAMDSLRQMIDRALAEINGVEKTKNAVRVTGVNGYVTADYNNQVKKAKSRSDLDRAAQDLAWTLVDHSGNQLNGENYEGMALAALDFAANGGTMSEALKGYGLTPWGQDEDMNRAFGLLGKYMKERLEAGPEEFARLFQDRKGQSAAAEPHPETSDEEHIRYSFKGSDGNVLEISEREISDNKKTVAQMEPVTTVSDEESNRFLSGDFIGEGEKYFKEIGSKANNPVIGEVTLDKYGLKHIVGRHTIASVKARVLPAIKHVIEKGYLVGLDNEHNGKAIDTAVIAGKVTLSDGDYFVGIVVSQHNGGTRGQENKYSFHSAQFIPVKEKDRHVKSGSVRTNTSVVANGSLSVFRVLQEILDVKNQNDATNQAYQNEQNPDIRWSVKDQNAAPEMTREQMERWNKELEGQLYQLEMKLERAETAGRQLMDEVMDRSETIRQLRQSKATRQEVDNARQMYRAALDSATKQVMQALEFKEQRDNAVREQNRLRRLLGEQKTEWKAKIRQKEEGRVKHEKYMNRLGKAYNKLTSMIEHPSKNKGWVPEELTRATGELIRAVSEGRGMDAAQLGRKVQKALEADDHFAEAFTDSPGLKKLYTETMQLLEDISGRKGSKSLIRNAEEWELNAIVRTMEGLVHQIQYANKLFAVDRGAEITTGAAKLIEHAEKTKRKTRGLTAKVRKYGELHLNGKTWTEVMSGHDENSVLYKMGEAAQEGQRKMEKLQMDGELPFVQLTQGKENEAKFRAYMNDMIETGITATDFEGKPVGKPMTINHDSLTALYQHWISPENREAMKIPQSETEEAAYGARYQIAVPDAELMKKGKIQEAVANATRYVLTEDQMNELFKKHLTEYDRQMSGAWDRTEETVWRNALNETSMQLNGFEIAGVEKYFPLTRDQNYIAKDFANEVTDNRLVNMGSLKERVKSSKPVMLMPLTYAVEKQNRDVSRYAGMAVPVRDIKAIYNAVMPGYGNSVKEAIRKNWGLDAAKYMEDLIADMQGARQLPPSFMSQLRSAYASGVLSMNASVTGKQAASAVTAAGVVSWKSIGKAMRTTKPANIEKLKEYSAGYYLRTGQKLTDMEANVSPAGFLGKLKQSRMMKTIEAADQWTTRKMLWAAEYEIQDTTDLKEGTDEYWKAVAKKYDEILEISQPTSGVLQKDAIARSTSEGVRMMTMFRTQISKNMNMIVNSVTRYTDKKAALRENPNDTEAKKAYTQARTKMAQTISGQVTSSVILAVMTMVGKALFHKMKDYEDDKGDLTAQSVAGQLLKDAGSSFASLIVGGSELYDLIIGVAEGKQPFDIEAAGISTINDLYQNTYSLLTAASVIGDSSLSADEKMKKLQPRLWKFAGSLSEILGVPLNNARNLVDGIAANTKDMIIGKPLSFQEGGLSFIGSAQGRDTSNKAVAGYIARAMMEGNQAEAVRLYNEQLRQGKTADSLNTAIATWQKENIPQIREAAEAIEWGDLAGYNSLINDLVSMGLSMSNAVKYVEAERGKMQKGDEGNSQEAVGNRNYSYDEIVAGMTKSESDLMYTNGQMNSLLEYGDIEQAKAIRDEMLKAGKKSSSINSSLTSHWKPLLQAAYAAGDMAEVRRITNMLVSMGMKRTTVTGWTTSGSGTSSSSSKKKSGFGSGSFGSGGFGSNSKKSSKKKSGFGSGSFGSGSFGK